MVKLQSKYYKMHKNTLNNSQNLPFYTLKSRGRIISQQRVQMILAMEIDLIYFTFILAHYQLLYLLPNST